MTPAIKYLSSTKFKRINAVRLFLQLFYVSDISTSSGTHISSEYLYKHRNCTRTSRLHWPYQKCPGRKAWLEWRSYINKYFTSGKQQLLAPLGRWTRDTPRTQQWNTNIDPQNGVIYVKSDEFFYTYRFSHRSRHRITQFG